MKRLVLASGALVCALAAVMALVLLLGSGQETALALGTARVWVAHMAPFTDTLPGTLVGVRVNSVTAIPAIGYGQTSGGYAVLPGASALVEIVLPGGQVIVSDTLTLADNTDYTVAIIGDGVNQPLELFAVVDDNSPPAAGYAKVRVAHMAPFSNTLPGTLVDIRTDEGFPVVTNVPYKASTPYVPLPAGEYDLKITTPGGGVDLLDLDPITLANGEILGAFAIGNGIYQPLGVLPLVYEPGQVIHYTYIPIVLND